MLHWETQKSLALPADYITDIPMSDDIIEQRDSFLIGAKAIGLMRGGVDIKPQQYLVADLLGAKRRFTTILMPRRSSKTTIILAWALGRCLQEPDLLVAYSMMTSQKKARQRYITDIAKPLERSWPNKDNRPFTLYKGNGTEWIRFNNGSEFYVYGPSEDSFRSDAFDIIVLDEAGEIEGEPAADILGAALPTQDTKPDAMLIRAGTGGRSQQGNMLWDALKAARNDTNDRHAAIAYWAPQNTQLEEVESWEPTDDNPLGNARELVELHHPGIGTLTTIERVKDSYDQLKPELFMREYLGVFSDPTGGNNLIPPIIWDAAKQDGELPSPPDKFGMAIAVHPDQACASIVAAWRDDSGKASFLVIDHRKGVRWVAERVLGLYRNYKMPISYDPLVGANMMEIEFLNRQSPRPKLDPCPWTVVRPATATLLKEISAQNFTHWGQEPLDNAAALVIKRAVDRGRSVALGRRASEDDITALEGAMLALSAFDRAPKRRVLSLD